MGYRDIEELVRRSYSRLFALPRDEVLVLIYVVDTVLVALLTYRSSSSPETLASVSTASLVYLGLLYLFYREVGGGYMGIHRILGIAVFSLTPYVVGASLASVAGRPPSVAYAASSGMLFLIRYIFWGNILTSIATAVSIGTVSGLVAEAPGLSWGLYRTVVVSVASVSIMTVFVLLVELMGRRNGVRAFELGRGFIRTWVLDDSRYLEEALERDSVRGSVRVGAAVLSRETGKTVVMVFPELHFGPFRRVGSSDAVYVFDKALGGSHHTLVFHTTGSHERDIVKRSYVEYMAETMRKTLESLREGAGGGGRAYVSYIGGPGAWSLYRLYNSGCEILVAWNDEGSDDIPIDTVFIEKIERSSGKRVFIADAHSVYGRREVDYSILERLIEQTVSGGQTQGDVVLRTGFGEAYMRSLCGGVCSGLVKALVLETTGGRDLILYIYGNNIVKTTSEKVRRLFHERGFRNVVLVTPDDHSCAATSVGDPYTAVRYCDDLVEALEKAVETALRDLSETSLYCVEEVFRDAPLMGGSVWSYIRGVERLGSLTPRLWTLFLLASIATVIL